MAQQQAAGGRLSIAVIGMYHETNTFAPGRTAIGDFASERVQGREAYLDRYSNTRTSMGGVIDASEAGDVELRPGLYVSATPSGLVEQETAEQLIRELTESAEDADGLIVILHGAMAAEHCLDMEGRLLQRIRGKFGRSVPVAVTLDLHANISRELVELADLVAGYDTYPHIDAYERAVEATELLIRMIRGEIAPVRALARPGLLIPPQGMMTGTGPMKEVMEAAFQLEKLPGVLNITVAGGFPYSDVPDAGFSVVVTTDKDPVLARLLAEELAGLAWKLRDRFRVSGWTAEESIRMAGANEEWPVVIVEGSDNVGGGAPGDATHLLRLLVRCPYRSLIVIRDAEAAMAAHQAGTGGRFEGPVGGRSGPLHGEPVYVQGTVRTLSDGRYKHVGPYMTGQWAFMGQTAVVDAGKLTVVLTEHRVPPWDAGHVRCLGLEPAKYQIIVVKSAVAWKTAFGDIAVRAVEADTPGCCSFNFSHFDYRQIRRPIYPLDLEDQVIPTKSIEVMGP